uniref:CHK kinase-like domain-containing protein n=1 Tax=Trichuris muris TaxID=70415 RepID=A0A5S6QK30_TRIMR
MNSPLCGTTVTEEHIKRALKGRFGDVVEQMHVECPETVGKDQGFLSYIFRVQLKSADERKAATLPSRIVVKTMEEGHALSTLEKLGMTFSKGSEAALGMKEMHNAECDAYTILRKEAPNLQLPECYAMLKMGTDLPAMLCLEDVSEQSACPDLATGITEAQLMSLADFVADLQAWSLNTHSDWKNYIPSAASTFARFQANVEVFASRLPHAVRQFPENMATVDVQKINAFLSNKKKLLEVFAGYREIFPDVLVHGDFWAYNIFFTLDKNGKTTDQLRAVIDWQLCHQGSFCEDLGRLFMCTVTPSTRRKCMKPAFRRYFDKVTKSAPEALQGIEFDHAYTFFERTVSFLNVMFLGAVGPAISSFCKGSDALAKRTTIRYWVSLYATMDAQICGTPLTGKMLEVALAETLPEAARNLNTLSGEIIGKGQGFLSHVIRVSLSWKTEMQNASLPCSVILKLPTMEHVDELFNDFNGIDREEVDASVQIDDLYRTEGNCYKMLSSEVPELPIPRCYCTWDKESKAMSLLVLQDFSGMAKSGDVVSGLTKEQLLNCVEAITVLQAWSLNTKCNWKSIAPEQETILDKFTKSAKTMTMLLEKTAEKYPEYFGFFSLKEVAAFTEDKERFTSEFMSYREVMPEVFVHGDFRAGNILFETGDTSRLAAIIDWQMAHQGSFAEDICYLMMFNVATDLRRSMMEEVIRHYLARMKTSLTCKANSSALSRNDCSVLRFAPHLSTKRARLFAMNQSLCGTKLTGEILEQLFVDAGKASPGSLERVSAEMVCHSGGYNSDILRLLLFWKENDESTDNLKTIMVKVPKQDTLAKMTSELGPKATEKMKEAFAVDEMFRVECAIYKMLPKEIPEFPMPKYCGTWSKAESGIYFMAIEDLSHIAKTPDLTAGLTKEQLMNCAKALALLHAWSLNTQCEWKEQLPSMNKYKDAYSILMDSTANQLEKSVGAYPTQLQCVNVEKVQAILTDEKNFLAAMTEYRKVLPDVLVHGDFWGNNILFQIDRETNLTKDLARLYLSSVDPEVRRSTAKEIFRCYFDRMQILAPRAMNSVSFESAYRIFETTLFYNGLAMLTFAHMFATIMRHDNPSLEAAMVNRQVEIYKDAAKFFNF